MIGPRRLRIVYADSYVWELLDEETLGRWHLEASLHLKVPTHRSHPCAAQLSSFTTYFLSRKNM